MQAWWAAVEQGESRLLLIEGDAGIGKTRLATELARHAEEVGCAGAPGSLRRGSGGALPAVLRGPGAVLPVVVGR